MPRISPQTQQTNQQNIYTVSRLNRQAKFLLEGELGVVWITGEISNLVTPASGHWYFTLKDDKAQLRCAMFRGNNNSVRFRPKNGDQVLIRGRLSLYEPRGDYQLIAETMEPAGDGLLKQQFEQLKQQLAAQGLFATHYKKPLPEQIKRVGIITSSTGAAVKDILAVAQRRQPSLEFIIYPSLVQGEGAAANLLAQLNTANHRNEVDVLILGRGGGSLEDLWCFNDEQLAHGIFNSNIPVISAVGHEIDFTIADFVADYRAPTPSAAAEIVTKDNAEMIQQIEHLRQRLAKAIAVKMNTAGHQAQLINQKLLNLHPEKQLQQQQQRLDELSLRLNYQQKTHLSEQQRKFEQLTAGLLQHNPQQKLELSQQQLEQLSHRLKQGIESTQKQAQQKLATVAQQLDLVSPLSTLARGYSITMSDDKLVRSANELKSGDVVTSKFKDGDVKSQVI